MNTNKTMPRVTKAKPTPDNISKWMPLWIGDTRRECIGQPPEFLGMYVNLLMAAWECNGQLPDDERHLRRISGANPEQWSEHRQAIANLFVPRNGVWTHNRLRDELNKASNISERRRAAAQKGNEVRWSGNSAAKAQTTALLSKISSSDVPF